MNMAGLVIYLMNVCNGKDDAVRHYHQSNGYQLFDKGHIWNMKIHKACASYNYVRVRCVKQTFLRETTYLVWVLLNGDGKVILQRVRCIQLHRV